LSRCARSERSERGEEMDADRRAGACGLESSVNGPNLTVARPGIFSVFLRTFGRVYTYNITSAMCVLGTDRDAASAGSWLR
jgi:hypothetical protein